MRSRAASPEPYHPAKQCRFMQLISTSHAMSACLPVCLPACLQARLGQWPWQWQWPTAGGGLWRRRGLGRRRALRHLHLRSLRGSSHSRASAACGVRGRRDARSCCCRCSAGPGGWRGGLGRAACVRGPRALGDIHCHAGADTVGRRRAAAATTAVTGAAGGITGGYLASCVA